jgi:uncharacterized membrane protein
MSLGIIVGAVLGLTTLIFIISLQGVLGPISSMNRRTFFYSAVIAITNGIIWGLTVTWLNTLILFQG